jgi:hypothetical protein
MLVADSGNLAEQPAANTMMSVPHETPTRCLKRLPMTPDAPTL